ncbi:hypothetical protein AYO44_04800 [Planctomycetaceae bacterium SCGC AG-212-F19]|nr:hypothetical protein AYO44_04800 [Planctomycetaceae bacterium SCGC AG-212-F19]
MATGPLKGWDSEQLPQRDQPTSSEFVLVENETVPHQPRGRAEQAVGVFAASSNSARPDSSRKDSRPAQGGNWGNGIFIPLALLVAMVGISVICTVAIYRKNENDAELRRHLWLLEETATAQRDRLLQLKDLGLEIEAEELLGDIEELLATTPSSNPRSDPAPWGSPVRDHSPSATRDKSVHVDGYYRKDGSYVKPHDRATPGMGRKK